MCRAVSWHPNTKELKRPPFGSPEMSAAWLCASNSGPTLLHPPTPRSTYPGLLQRQASTNSPPLWCACLLQAKATLVWLVFLLALLQGCRSELTKRGEGWGSPKPGHFCSLGTMNGTPRTAPPRRHFADGGGSCPVRSWCAVSCPKL